MTTLAMVDVPWRSLEHETKLQREIRLTLILRDPEFPYDTV